MRVLLNLGFLLLAVPLLAQSNMGELRLKVTDPSGLGVRASITVISDALQFHGSLDTDDAGVLAVRNLPFGPYKLVVEGAGFSSFTGNITIRTALPTEYVLKLNIAGMSTAVDVMAASTLVDPTRTASSNRIDLQTKTGRATSIPGRSITDLVESRRDGFTRAARCFIRAAPSTRPSLWLMAYR